jgi:hypothetical protein
MIQLTYPDIQTPPLRATEATEPIEDVAESPSKAALSSVGKTPPLADPRMEGVRFARGFLLGIIVEAAVALCLYLLYQLWARLM